MPKNPNPTSSARPEDPPSPDSTDSVAEDPRRLLETLTAAHRANDPAVLEDLCRQPRFRSPELIELLSETVEALRPDDPERAKDLAKLGIRLAARLPNATFARIWDLWSTTCGDLGLDTRATAGRMIAGIFDEGLRPGPSTAPRKRKTPKRRKPRRG